MTKILLVLSLFSICMSVSAFDGTSSSQDQDGKSGCTESYNGKVACGKNATGCIESYNGNVACGRNVNVCIESYNGKVACGGNAKSCIESYNGNVACPE